MFCFNYNLFSFRKNFLFYFGFFYFVFFESYCCSKKIIDFNFIAKNFGIKDEDVIQKNTVSAANLDTCITSFMNGVMLGYLTKVQLDDAKNLPDDQYNNEKLTEYSKAFSIICCCRLGSAQKADDCLIDVYFVRSFNSSNFKADNFEKHTVKLTKDIVLKESVFKFLKDHEECVFFNNSLGNFLINCKLAKEGGDSLDVDFYAFRKKKKKS